MQERLSYFKFNFLDHFCANPADVSTTFCCHGVDCADELRVSYGREGERGCICIRRSEIVSESFESGFNRVCNRATNSGEKGVKLLSYESGVFKSYIVCCDFADFAL